METRQYFIEVFLEYSGSDLSEQEVHASEVKREILEKLNQLMQNDFSISNYSATVKSCSTFSEE